jgi:hypothetical protein
LHGAAGAGLERRVVSGLILALPVEGAAEGAGGGLAGRRGVRLVSEGGARGYRASLAGLPGAEVRLLSAGEIAAALDGGEIHLGVTGEDLLREREGAVEGRLALLRGLGFGRADLVIAAPRSWLDVDAMADVEAVAHDFLARTGRRLRVATKYACRRGRSSPGMASLTTASSTRKGRPKARRRRARPSWWWTSPPRARRWRPKG